MKKYTCILLTLLMLSNSSLKAQENTKRFHFGPKIGMLVSDIKYKDLDFPTGSDSYNYHPYYQFVNGNIGYTNMNLNLCAGIAFEYDIIPIESFGLSVQITPQYARKGCWYLSDTSYGMTGNIYMHYMDLPIDFRGKYHLSKKINLVIGLGPTFNIGLSQVNKIQKPEGDDIKHNVSRIQFGEKGNGLHRLDIGANATMGIELIRDFRFDLSYYIPLRNLSIDKSKSVKHFSVAASIGYMF